MILLATKRKHKDTVFTKLFGNPKNFIELYNAITGSNYPLDTPIEIATLDTVLFMGRKNDVAFVLDGKIVILIEHQSTINKNMPLRLFLYVARIYEQIIDSDEAIYHHKQLLIPRPEFIVLYNGQTSFPSEKTLKLSDSYIESNYPSLGGLLELEVRVVNINAGQNEDMVQRSKNLSGYVTFITLVRRYEKAGMKLEDAITKAVRECIQRNVLSKFLKTNGAEVLGMLTAEWNWDTAKKVWQKEAKEEDALAMIRERLPLDVITRCTGIPLSELKSLQTAE